MANVTNSDLEEYNYMICSAAKYNSNIPIPNSIPENAKILCEEMIKKARKNINIFLLKFEDSIFDNNIIIQRLECAKNRDVNINIFVNNLSKKLNEKYSFINFNQSNFSFHNHQFMTIDKLIYWFEKEHIEGTNELDAIGNFNDEYFVNKINKFFTILEGQK